MPGAGFKRDAAEVKISVEEAHVKPYEMVQSIIVRCSNVSGGHTIGDHSLVGCWRTKTVLDAKSYRRIHAQRVLDLGSQRHHECRGYKLYWCVVGLLIMMLCVLT